MSIQSPIEEMYGIKVKEAVNVHDVIRIQTATDTYCLKKYDFPEDKVRFITRIFSWLEQSGFTRGQRALPTLMHSAYATYDGSHYTLTNWVDGRKPDFQHVDELKQAIRTLAKFHKISKGFPIEEAPPSRILYSNLYHGITGYRNELILYKHTEHLVPLCDEALEYLSHPFVVEAIAAEQRVSAFIHGDYNYSNLVKDKRSKLHVIDFDNASLNVRMKDLSHILHRNFVWDASGMLHWIDYYQQKRQLSQYDLTLLYALLINPYPVYRSIKISGLRHAKSVIPTKTQLKRFKRELRALL
ncbi:phosphotransferase [Paenibacillus filicis]|uniref:Phosphotransferase n=1 Tax=Paenibacillus gyeongsangnamensis TaxID=3388067 RepID=A0ABT4QF34_9BACL|nr:phosphotransferase [Paenibacillus filicis]MCZ8515361.1 phosphotransferase [Paenibacillus filicis]